MVPTPRRPRPITVRPNALANLDRSSIKGPDLFLSDTPRFKRFIPPPEPISAPSLPHLSALHAVEIQQLRAEISTLKRHVKSLSTTNKLLNTQLRLARSQGSKPTLRQNRGGDRETEDESSVVPKRTLTTKPQSTIGGNDGDSGIAASSKVPESRNQQVNSQRPISLTATDFTATSKKPLRTLGIATSTLRVPSPKLTAKRLSSGSSASRRSSGMSIR